MDERELRAEITAFVAGDAGNMMPGFQGERIFDEPVIGFADARDGIFQDYKRIIGGFHSTPLEWLGKTYPGERFDSGSVICWALPITEATRISNREEMGYPSRRWALTKLYGERFNQLLRHRVVKLLTRDGFKAVASAASDRFETLFDDNVGRASNWSERHAAYAAGLGTFSLSDGFITEKGIAVRIGSAITDMKLKPNGRRFKDHRENCLFFQAEKCVACAGRCPAGAITEKGHDKVKCREYVNGAASEYALERYGLKTAACGLCQCGVPCESKIPSIV
ncbi:MAG: epoxyqueuosine reductase [Candidatus Altiarchaeota archaeon]